MMVLMFVNLDCLAVCFISDSTDRFDSLFLAELASPRHRLSLKNIGGSGTILAEKSTLNNVGRDTIEYLQISEKSLDHALSKIEKRVATDPKVKDKATEVKKRYKNELNKLYTLPNVWSIHYGTPYAPKRKDYIDFSKFKNLRKLVITQCNLSEKSLETLKGCKKLRYLEIEQFGKGHIERIMGDRLADIPNLEYLYITASHSLDKIEIPSNIVSVQKLKTLIITGTPTNNYIFKIPTLEALKVNNVHSALLVDPDQDLESIETITLPKDMGVMSKLKLLSIEGPVSNVPESIGQLKSLEYLRIKPVKSAKYPASFANLKSLRFLDAWEASNAPAIGHLDSLVYLKYDVKALKTKISFQGCNTVKKVFIRGRKLKVIPSNIDQASALVHFEVLSDSIKTLPDYLCGDNEVLKCMQVKRGEYSGRKVYLKGCDKSRKRKYKVGLGDAKGFNYYHYLLLGVYKKGDETLKQRRIRIPNYAW